MSLKGECHQKWRKVSPDVFLSTLSGILVNTFYFQLREDIRQDSMRSLKFPNMYHHPIKKRENQLYLTFTPPNQRLFLKISAIPSQRIFLKISTIPNHRIFLKISTILNKLIFS